MYFSWPMHLFIILVFSTLSSGKRFSYDDSSDEIESTTQSLLEHEITDDLNHYPETEWTTKISGKKTTKRHAFGDDDDDDDDENQVEHGDGTEEELNDDEHSSTIVITTTSPSSLTSKIATTNSQRETPSTRATWSFSPSSMDTYLHFFTTATLDPKEIALYIAKANRERLLLKIFAITVTVGMSSLAIALITIHIVRKSKRYHGYRVPANVLPNKQLNDIHI